MSTREKEVGLVSLLLLVIFVCVWFVAKNYASRGEPSVPAPVAAEQRPALSEEQKAQIMDHMQTSSLSTAQKNKILDSVAH